MTKLILNDIGPYIPQGRRKRRSQTLARHYVFRDPADLLRKKNVTFGRRLGDGEALSRDLPRVIADAFEVATPLMRYLAGV